MARKRNRSSGGKDSDSFKHQLDKREELTTNKVDVEAVKPSSSFPKEDTHRNGRARNASTKASTQLGPLTDSPTSELCSVLHGFELNFAASGKKFARRAVVGKTNVRGNNRNRSEVAKKLYNESEQLGESPREEQPTSTVKEENNDDEVVRDSQEMIESSCAQDEDEGKIIMDAEQIFLLYEHLSGEKCKLPEKSTSVLRNEYRELYCIGTMCEKLSDIMSSRLASAQQLRNQRIESLSQLKALSLRLEDLIMADLAVEKYLSFDDTAQRDALEIMNIRYEELSDDIFTADDEFSSMFDGDDIDLKSGEKVLTQPGYSLYNDLGANYAGLCLHSKLTEVGLQYVDAVHGMIKRSNADVSKCRALIVQKNRQIAATTSQINSVREGLGDLAPVVDRVIGVTHLECSKTSMFKSRST